MDTRPDAIVTLRWRTSAKCWRVGVEYLREDLVYVEVDTLTVDTTAPLDSAALTLVMRQVAVTLGLLLEFEA